jgi:hypothetical protein
MTAPRTVRPAGYAATAADFLDEAAADGDGEDLGVRQLAALQGIGYALLALGELLAEGTDATADCATQLAGVIDAIDSVHQQAECRLRWLRGRFFPGGERR